MTSQTTAAGAHLPTPSEIQSGHDRQRWAEQLIEQLPSEHDGRNSWLLNFGIGEEAQKLREDHHLPWSEAYRSAFPRHIHKAGTLVGKHIDTCAHCGADIRNEIHHGTNFTIPDFAALISAAPFLLDFARWVADRGGDNNPMEIFKRARTVVSKATGASS